MTIEKNTELKMALFQDGISQAELCRRTGIPQAIPSMAVQGKYNLSDEQKSHRRQNSASQKSPIGDKK